MVGRRDERGVALLTVLLLVAVMSLVAVGVLDDIRFAIRRARNAETVGQAQWYALGAETLAKTQVRRLLSLPAGASLGGGREGQALAYPIEGGTLAARLIDRGACFNLNSVVIGPPEAPIADETGMLQFAELLRGAGVDDSRSLGLAQTLADWIDANNETARFGAEDPAYAVRKPAYRTAGTLLAEESELRAVAGFTPEVYARIRPYVCALPTTGPTRINLNALTPQDAPVLSAVYRGRLPLEAARRVIEERPPAGWMDESAFLKSRALEVLAERGGEPPLQQLSTRSRYFSLDADVRYGDAEVVLSSLLDADPAGPVRTAARRWTVAE